MTALPELKACLSPSEHELTVSSSLPHASTFKRASRMENDEASFNSRPHTGQVIWDEYGQNAEVVSPGRWRSESLAIISLEISVLPKISRAACDSRPFYQTYQLWW